MKKTLSIILAIMLIALCVVSCKAEPEVKLTSIEITKDPTKTTYKVGESFNKAGMEVTAYYSDGTSKVVTDYTYSPTTAFDKENPRTAITVTYKDGEVSKSTKITVIVGNSTSSDIAVESISLDKTTLSLTVDDEQTLTATVTPTNATNKNITWSSSDAEIATVDQTGKVTAKVVGAVTITATTEDGNMTVVCTVTVKAPTKGKADVSQSAGRTLDNNQCGWVQLWESGPKWAEFNVGSTISSYSGVTTYDSANVGGYYEWGGTTDKDTEATAGTNYSDSTTDIQGTGTIGTDTLGDTAKLLWGSNWKMPRIADLGYLIAYCTWTWCDGSTSHYDDPEGATTGTCTLAGYKVTGKGDYAGNSIFIPAAGYYTSSPSGQGTYGHYWSSNPSLTDNAFRLYFDGSNEYLLGYSSSYGYSVRAILAE